MTTAAARGKMKGVVVDTIDTGNYVLLNPSDLEQKIFAKKYYDKGLIEFEFSAPREPERFLTIPEITPNPPMRL
jgi:hypothetical protein